MARYVSYIRVSTKRQGKSGLGLEAQQEAIRMFLEARGGDVLAEFREVESGAHNDRPELARAIERVRLTGAKLLVAKLDRLSRDAEFIFRLQRLGVAFVCADMPEADELTIGFLAVMAQRERRLIRERTKAALAAAKARGKKIGNPMGAKAFGPNAGKGSLEARRAKAADFVARVGSTVSALRAQGMSFRAVAAELNAMGVQARRGGQWSPNAVKRVEDALKAQAAS